MSVLWYTVPLAVALALSVVPIIAVLVLLLAPDPLGRSVPFASGSVLGIAALVTAFAIGASLVPTAAEDEFPPWIHVVEIAVGVCLMVTALVLTLRKRDASPTERSSIEAATSRLTRSRAFGFGVLMNVRPKSLVLTVAAGLAIGTAPIDPVIGGVTVAVFTLISGSVVAGLVIAYAIGQTRVRPAFARLRHHLETHAGLVLRGALFGTGLVLVIVGIVQLAIRQ